MNIFISYSSKDEQKVKAIKKLMPESEVNIWIDHHELKGGSILWSNIKKGIDSSDIYFLFVSQNSIDSDWVQKEIKWAIEREEKLRYEFIVPIVLESEAWDKLKNKTIKEKLFIDYNNKDSFELANEIKDTIISKVIQKFDKKCILAKDKLFEIMGSTISGILIVIAFFTEPTEQKHIDYILYNAKNCSVADIKYTDMVNLLNFTTCKTGKDTYFLTVGVFGEIYSKEMTE